MAGIYVTTKLSDQTCSRLRKFADKLPLPTGTRMKEKEYHITLAYSKEGFAYKHNNLVEDAIVFPESWEIFGTGDERVLVLTVRCEKLQRRFKELVEQGYECKFPTYRPHITIAMAPSEAVDLSKLELPDFPIIVLYEYSEPLDDYKYDPKAMCEATGKSFLRFFNDTILRLK